PQGLHPHLFVAVRGDEDRGDAAVFGVQLRLQLETRNPGHSDVYNQTRRLALNSRLQKFLRGSEGTRLQPDRLHQTLQRVSHGLVVIDDGGELVLARFTVLRHGGTVSHLRIPSNYTLV